METAAANDTEKGQYAQLQQNLVGPEPDEHLQKAPAVAMIEVIAPATLSEGYKFEAEVGGRTFSVTVPPGGVEQGQKFTVPLNGESTSLSTESLIPSLKIPVGAWRDDTCSCCTHGPCHTHLWVGLGCTLIGIAQVISRLKLNIWGQPGNVGEQAAAFQQALCIVFAFITIYGTLTVAVFPYQDDPDPPIFVAFFKVFSYTTLFVFAGFTMSVVFNVRAYIRNKYAIPEMEPKTGVEDLLCAIFCSPCTTAQMMRHTADYDTYHANCCTSTGLPSHTPSIV